MDQRVRHTMSGGMTPTVNAKTATMRTVQLEADHSRIIIKRRRIQHGARTYIARGKHTKTPKIPRISPPPLEAG
jgi:hypothetical protein